MKVLQLYGRQQACRMLSEVPGIELGVVYSCAQQVRDSGFDCDFKEVINTRAKVDPVAIRAIRKIMIDWKPDIVHSITSKIQGNAVLASQGLSHKPIIVATRGVVSRLNFVDLGNWLAYRHPRVDFIECKSNAVREALLKSGIPERKCVTTWDYIDPRVPTAGVNVLSEFGVPDDAFVIGCAANIRRVKGVDVLLRAFDRIAGQGNIHLVLVGHRHDPLVEKLVKNSPYKDRIHFTGFRLNVGDYMSRFDLFTMASRQEGLCLALMEAMSLGVPAIVSEAGGMKEVVRHGRDGLVVPIGDVAALADAIDKLYRDTQLRASMAAEAPERIRSHFGNQAFINRLVDFYRHAMETKRTKIAA
ncbi:glycosyltransferase family 4 protein [Rubinisphaera brasiliensis]|uniref:Glycosyl transferase group 1 n=1 Tax=Rubinisphaera brasiliensis (strain ATCC 49424 / DSM 5305 / JCM 21570 / IAM 15109 / NBRC 103401 / IFAM 1448) TaxID=756272 RepID=F0SFT9_RUBBR|nr:glycosyltransferase family 4 protein [Rubinisphaera brasiliensis]ADY61546.1 glycosyl transferase group 1 [Rubinisphaera brasiliensis DSM 5305]